MFSGRLAKEYYPAVAETTVLKKAWQSIITAGAPSKVDLARHISCKREIDDLGIVLGTGIESLAPGNTCHETATNEMVLI